MKFCDDVQCVDVLLSLVDCAFLDSISIMLAQLTWAYNYNIMQLSYSYITAGVNGGGVHLDLCQ